MSRSTYARLIHRFAPDRFDANRRQALRVALAASAGLLLSGPVMGLTRPARSAGKRVVVVGAGFSGLACAHELLSAGYDVTVVEARDRVSGRVVSFSDFVPGRNVEGGGELIGSNHPTWVAYAKKFDLEFLDVTEAEEATLPIVLDGKLLDAAQAEALWEEMETAVATMNADSVDVPEDEPWTHPNAAALDRRTTRQWIDAQEVGDMGKRALSVSFMADNGVDPSRQSYLGNLAQVKGGGGETYWTDSEVYRCKGGNMLLARKLAEAIGMDRIILGLPVRSIRAKGQAMLVECSDGRVIECDDVVLATPPSTWSKIAIAPALPAVLSPQMGVNVKYLAHLKDKFWEHAKLAPDALSDGDVNMTWDGTDNQGGTSGDATDDSGPACLVCFSGGPAAENARGRKGEDRRKAYAAELERFFPGYGAQFVSDRMMDWPADPWTLASYSFPAPGQVTTVGPLLRRGLGRLHFAGEHACYKFVGYMEGALNAGASLAARLAARDGIIREVKPLPAAVPAGS